MVDGFDQQIDQVINEGAAAQMGKGGQPGQSGCLWMPAQFIRRFDCNALPVALQLPLVGSYSSALAIALLLLSTPPATSTLSLGSNVAV